MTPVAYRAADCRRFLEPPRLMQAHQPAFIDHAHRAPAPEPLWRAVAVFGAGIVGIALLVTVVLGAVPG